MEGEKVSEKMNCIDLLKIQCNGCGLCMNICPTHSIRMQFDSEGFLVPYVNKESCVECGACTKACEENRRQSDNKNTPIEVYACQTKDNTWAIESTAGGFFPTLAQFIIEEGGVVFGTAFSSDMEAIVCKAETIDDIKKFNGSKYVQSNLSMAFEDVRNELDKGKLVLFSGTPCQIAAIKTFLKDTNIEKLITIDVICYGVPSPGLFKSFLQTIEKKKHCKVIDYRFRDKHENGWSHTTVVTLQNKEGKIKKITEKDYRKIPYYRMFGRRNCFRKLCYACQYNTIDRITDYTTGNFWGIEKMTPFFDTYLGVSLVLINTDKGRRFFEKISDRMSVKEMQLEQAIKANDALTKSSQYSNERDEIYKYYAQKGFQKMYHKYYSINYYKIGKRIIKKLLHRQ